MTPFPTREIQHRMDLTTTEEQQIPEQETIKTISFNPKHKPVTRTHSLELSFCELPPMEAPPLLTPGEQKQVASKPRFSRVHV